MSSQFSYELDERQIKILMQDAELNCNEALWNKFELLDPNLNCSKSSSVQIGNYMPKFNLSISRSVVVPILFIILIGGLSAMLFSFVDFKKKETIDKEVPLVANPENYKKPESSNTDHINAAKLVEVKATPIETINAAPVTSITPTPSVTIADVKKEEAVKVNSAISKKTEEITPKEVAIVKQTEIKKETTVQPVKKKRKTKVAAEELPTIKAVSTNLNEGSNEPELDLK